MMRRGMKYENNAPILANDLALRFPDGFWAELGRFCAAAYFNAYNNSKFDPDVGRADEKVDRGHRRWAYMNTALRKLKDSWPDEITIEDVCMGPDKGSNNHVELRVNKYLLTHHHLTGSKNLPDGSKYLTQNTDINEDLEQLELIPVREYMPETGFNKPFNVLVLHREDPQSGADLGQVELVFANGRRRLAVFELSEISKLQALFAEMSPEDLFDLKFRHEEAKRRYNA